ncbi:MULTISPECIES: hypothetical protein [Streptomyces]|uniref:Uncharacterized protein n=2 Tax=Streptomyces viridosporus TaxID=67581 RepID=A0ABX6AF97_STRVD|nr:MULTISPECIES: hypothetical protein [Streptomyces]EFE69468.1 secreted protein [Streptomyces viridosporus ATCC 14672]PWJ07400.1 hypothetical protein DKG34_12595 [Streptomyces sp. NWU49]QEU85778.1 hypothetical protein CP969_14445 [Streptomyces viridosporus T7A]
MAAPARVPSPALSKPAAEPFFRPEDLPGTLPEDLPEGHHLCVFSAEGPCTETPLTSEPPLPDAEPLTSEPPLADAAPLTSESDAATDPSGLAFLPTQYRPEP